MNTHLLDRSEMLMGGTFNIKCYPQELYTQNETEFIIKDAFGEVKRIENHLTIFKDSVFNSINYNAGLSPVKVSSEIIELIDKSRELSIKTDGAFDITYASIEELWKQAGRLNVNPTEEEIKVVTTFVDYKKILINRSESTVFLPDKKMRISLGGIGKGYAVDQAFNLMKNRGLKNFYVNGAGDIRVHSSHDAPRPWKIGIRNPFNDDPNIFIGFIEITNEACATSGDYVNKTIIDGKRVHHILSPKTGQSTKEVVSCTIITKESIVSDTMATIGMLLGVRQAIDYFNRENIIAMLVDNNGNSHLSKKAIESFEKYVKNKTKELL